MSIINNEEAYECILQKNTTGLDSYQFQPHVLIEHVKNDLDELEFLLDYLERIGCDPGSNSEFFTGITDCRTFDLYHEYDIDPINIDWYEIPDDQWKYIHKIGFINKETFYRGYSGI